MRLEWWTEGPYPHGSMLRIGGERYMIQSSAKGSIWVHEVEAPEGPSNAVQVVPPIIADIDGAW